MSESDREDLDFLDWNVVIAGNSASLGDRLANTFVEAGAKIAAFTINKKLLDEAILESNYKHINSEGEITEVFGIEESVIRVECTQSDKESVLEVWKEMAEELGNIDMFIHTGGRISGDIGLKHDENRKKWLEIISESTKRYESMMQAAATVMGAQENKGIIVNLHHHARRDLFNIDYWNPYEQAVKQKRQVWKEFAQANDFDEIRVVEIVMDLVDRSQLPRFTTAYQPPKIKMEPKEPREPVNPMAMRCGRRRSSVAKPEKKKEEIAPEISNIEVPVFNYATSLDDEEIVNSILFLLILPPEIEVPIMNIQNTWMKSKPRRRGRYNINTRYI